MFSYSSALVLGILAEKPNNAYEIKKLLGRISIKKWLPIAPSSLYATIRSLAQSGMVDCETAKDGNMPEKKIYYINEKGMGSLRETLLGFLGSVDMDKKKTQIACLMLCRLQKEEAVGTIVKKLKKLENAEAMLKRISESFEASGKLPYTALLTIRHELGLTQSELAFTKELLSQVVADEKWDHTITGIA